MTHLVRAFEALRKTTGLKAHHLETLIAATILTLVAVVSGRGWVEWIGVFGVTLTFEYQVLSTYLREHSEARKKVHGPTAKDAAVLTEIQILYYLKECVWIAYFLFLGAYSALAGTIIFIAYGFWRRLYRQALPIAEVDII